jgi:hypothetical protein
VSHSPANAERLVDAGSRLVAELAERVSQIEGRRAPLDAERVSTGCAPLDEALSAGGLQRGTLVEWLAARAGGGAATLALVAASQAAETGGAVVVVDRRRGFYPPAALSWGLTPEQLILVRPTTLAEERWAWDQILRSAGVAALLAWPERLDDREFRRLQLAAETSGALGLLVRPLKARDEPSWADLRLLVEPRSIAPTRDASLAPLVAARPIGLPTQSLEPIREPPGTVPILRSPRSKMGLSPSPRRFSGRFLQIEILRARGKLPAHRKIEVTLIEQRGDWHAETGSLRVAPRLAARTTGRDARGA